MRLWILTLLLMLAAPAGAEKHALLIGIDHYDDRERINGLTAAARDAEDVAKTLVDAAGFRRENVRVLTTNSAAAKPDKRAIIRELRDLGARVKPGDLALFFFAGHGMEINGTTFLLPADLDGSLVNERDALLLEDGAISTTLFTQYLRRINAKSLLLCFDMCRNNPVRGAQALSGRSVQAAPAVRLVPRQVRNLGIKPSGDGTGPEAIATLFACKAGQRSFEWQQKGRGYFSWFLERGLRGEAADADGSVRLGPLVQFVESKVYSTVLHYEKEEQTPYPVLEGASLQLVLASGVRAAAPTQTGIAASSGASDPEIMKRYEAAFSQAVELMLKRRYREAQPLFEQALKLVPTSARAAHELGRIQDIFHKNAVEAERLYRLAMKLDPKWSRPVNNLGTLFYDRKEFAEAEKLFKQSLALNSADSYPLNSLGLLHTHSPAHRNYQLAEGYLRKAIEVDPAWHGPYANLAILYTLMGKPESAILSLEKRAQELKPPE